MPHPYTFTDYSPEWPVEFEREAARLRALLGDALAVVHHIGSTSVPGLSAKPIIDLLPEVRSLARVDELIPVFEQAGYVAKGENGLPGRRYFAKARDGHRTHHVHVYQTGHPDIERLLAFRDYLRSHPDVRDEYATLKRAIHARHPTDSAAYSAEKDGWIRSVELLALEWYRGHGALERSSGQSVRPARSEAGSPQGSRMTIRDAYDRWAASYDADRNLTRDLDAEVTRQALGGVGGTAVLEIGCGTGKNTAWLAGIARRVLALDFSPGMLRVAQARLRAASAENVTLALADLAHPWPCASGWSDLVACNLVLEHITDLAPIFAEATRVLAAGGRLFVSELHPYQQYQGKRAAYEYDGMRAEIPATAHHLSDFLEAAGRNGLALQSLREWWHDEDRGEPPRVVTFLFAK